MTIFGYLDVYVFKIFVVVDFLDFLKLFEIWNFYRFLGFLKICSKVINQAVLHVLLVF